MARIRLSLLQGKIAPESDIANAEHLKKLPKEKIGAFLEWAVNKHVRKEAYTEAQWEITSKRFGFKTAEELYAAMNFALTIFTRGSEIEQSELESDLRNLDFEQECIKLIMHKLESLWDEKTHWLKRVQPDTIPILVSLRWRIDIRYASSVYLKEPEVVALLRIGTHDGTQGHQVYVELDKDNLSWLETIIGKAKREMLKAEEILTQMDTK